MSREFLMLAKTYNPDKDRIGGRYVSEKLDGTRVFWDGGLSRGTPLTNVPWANLTNPKTGEPKPNLPLVATGLWSRYGNPIMAPDWFLNQLPACLLDGELWAGRGNFQTLRSIIAQNNPDERWHDVQFAVFGSPPITEVFGDGLIKNANFVHSIQETRANTFVMGRMEHGLLADFQCLRGKVSFSEELSFLNSMIPSDGSSVLYLHQQCKLPTDDKLAEGMLDTFLKRILDDGGEGVMLRDPKSVWTPKRVGTLLKWKPFNDDAGVVVGFTSGRQTDKGSKHLGKIGALILNYGTLRLELSGMTDEERLFHTDEMAAYAASHPGEDMPPTFQGKHFKTGDVVEFRYRELSDDGIPKEARYLRPA
jgi:DNA ligase-1